MLLFNERQLPSLLNSLLSDSSSIDESQSNALPDHPKSTTYEQFSSQLATTKRLMVNPPIHPLMSFHRVPVLSDRVDVEMIDTLYIRSGLVKPLKEFIKKANEQMADILKSRPNIKPLVMKKARFYQRNRSRSSEIPSTVSSSSVVTLHAFVPSENEAISAYRSHSVVNTANKQELDRLKPSAPPPFNDDSESSPVPSQENPSSPQAAAQAPPGPPALPKNEAESKSSASKASDMAMSPPFHDHQGSDPSEPKKRKFGSVDKNTKAGRTIPKQTAKKSTTQSLNRLQLPLPPCQVVLLDMASYVDVLKGYPYVTCSVGKSDTEPLKKKKSKRDKDGAEAPCKKAKKSGCSDGIVPKIRISLKPASPVHSLKVVDKENSNTSVHDIVVDKVESRAKNDKLETQRKTDSHFKEFTPSAKIGSPPKLRELSGLVIPQSPPHVGELVQNTALSFTTKREGGSTVPPVSPRHNLKPPSPPLTVLNDNNLKSSLKVPKIGTGPLKKYIKLAEYRKRRFLKSLATNNNNNVLKPAEDGGVATCLPMDQTPSSDIDVPSQKLTSLQFIGYHNPKKVCLEMTIPDWDDLICVPCDLKFRSPLDWSRHVTKH